MERPTGAVVVGILDIAGGVLGLLWALLVLVGGAFISSMLFMPGMEGAGVVGGVITFMALLSAALSIFSIYVGWSVMQLKNWARIVSTIFAVLSLLGFPLGTVIGLIKLYFLWVHEPTKNAFK